MSMEMTELSLSRILVEKHKKMISEAGDSNSRRDSDSDSSTDSTGSPPHKRPRRLIVCDTFEELDKIDAEDIFPIDFLDWFVSFRAEANENNIFYPRHYGKWFMTLGNEAKEHVLHPGVYTQWYVRKFDRAVPLVFPSLASYIPVYSKLAVQHFNQINKCDYEYVRGVAINECGDSSHLNFYGRLKVSPSGSESEPPQKLFFADVDFEYDVLECHILDSDEFGDATVLHPPDTYCPECSGAPLEAS